MEHDFSGRFGGNFRKQRYVWKGRPVFPVGIFQTEICALFLQGHLWYQFQPFAAVFHGKWNWLEQMENSIPGRNLPVSNDSWTLLIILLFANVNGKQPEIIILVSLKETKTMIWLHLTLAQDIYTFMLVANWSQDLVKCLHFPNWITGILNWKTYLVCATTPSPYCWFLLFQYFKFVLIFPRLDYLLYLALGKSFLFLVLHY